MAARTIAKTAAPTASARKQAGILSLLLGAFLVWGAGLANSEALHDAAHDTRHSYGFPCH
jgi:cobalt transporter subunit CbtB